MRPLVFGAGAVGIGLASALLAAGHRVQLVARGETRDAIAANGITRTGILGATHHAPGSFDLVGSAAEARDANVVLVCVKSFDSAAAATALAEAGERIDPGAPVVSCQNGWGNAACLEPVFGRERVFCASILTGFRRPARHTADVTVHAVPIRMGSLSGSATDAIEPLCAAITAGGIACETTGEMAAEIWAKLLYNGCLNPLGALLGVPYGVLAERADTRATMSALAHETFSVLHAAGFETHWPAADVWLAHFYDVLIPPTRAHESSMLQDLRAGRRTEIDALTGAIVALADRHGLGVPESRRLLAAIRAAERERRP